MKLFKIMKIEQDGALLPVTTVEADSYASTEHGKVVFYVNKTEDRTTTEDGGWFGSPTVKTERQVKSVPVATFQLFCDFAIMDATVIPAPVKPQRRKNV